MQQIVPAWKDITDDPEVSDRVEHCHLEFIDGAPPAQETDYKIIQFNDAESAIIDSETVKFLNKGVIVESTHSQGEFISSIFLRLKSNEVDYADDPKSKGATRVHCLPALQNGFT